MPAKASMALLPTETKTRIAELCSLQDKVFQGTFYRLEDIARTPTFVRNESDEAGDYDSEEETDVFKRGPFTDGRYERASYPKSLLSLSRVSKEWRDIAVKIVFRKLDVRGCSKPIFLYALARRYGHLVEELDICYWPEACHAINALTSLAHLSNVRKIALPSTEHVCERLASQTGDGDFPVEFGSPAFVKTALQGVVQRAETVVFPTDTHGLEDTIKTIRGAQHLTELNLHARSGDLPTLLSAIIDMPSLRKLEITSDIYDRHTFRDAASLPYVSHPTLRRLEISDESGGKGLYDFVQRFTSTLEELRIFWGPITREEVERPEPPRFHLPRLQRLEVCGGLIATAPCVRAISSAAFPALQGCVWVLNHSVRPDARQEFPAEAVAAIGQMRGLQIDRTVPLKFTFGWPTDPTPATVAMLQPALTAAGIPLDVEEGGVVVGIEKPDLVINYGPPDPPALILTPKLCRTDDSKVDKLGNDISASLDRIRDLKDQAVAVGDRVQISRIAQALQEGEWLCVERQC